MARARDAEVKCNVVSIDNQGGFILSGGGGGVGGPGQTLGGGLSDASCGGGAGYGNRAGGARGNGGGVDGSAGSGGTSAGPSCGGADGSNPSWGPYGTAAAGGGAFGQRGGDIFVPPYTSTGGAAGLAIHLNGGSVTWISGANNVAGAVS